MPDDLLMCPVCLETVEDPHVLPQCGHTFCKRCIDGVAQGGSTLRCPTCRQPNQAAQARPNFALRQLLADGATGTSAGSSSSAPARSTANDQRATTEGDVHRRVDAGNRDQEHALVSLGVPPSLAELLCDEDKQIGLRIFLLDNSGSTAMGDGKYFYTDERDGRTYSAGCTRWEEISRMAVEQAEWNAAIQVPTEFCLLNARGDDNIPCRIDPKKGDVGRQIEGLRLLLKRNGPTGVTPLATRITAIAERLRQQEQQLISAGQKVVLHIATDGLPTSASSGHSTSATRDQLSRLLRQIQLELPIYLVIRLTTDDDSTIEYYNSIDSEIEVNMEVLDDIEAEAQEIQQAGNGWLVYTPLIHKIREAGTFTKLFDLLDERALTPSEVALFVQLLLRDSHEPPFPRQPREFAAALAAHPIPLGYCSIRKRMMPIVDVAGVRHAMQLTKGQQSQMTAIIAVLAVVVALMMMLVGSTSNSELVAQ